MLNALLGLGTALAPVFVAVFVGLGFWWGLPLISTVLLVLLLAGSRRLPLRAETGCAAGRPAERGGIPSRFWLFAAFAVLYGICETMNGNWSQHDMTSALGASTTQAALALTAFWAMVTVGRVALRRDRALGAAARHLPGAAVRAGRDVRRSPRSSPTATSPAGDRGVRPGRARVAPRCCRSRSASARRSSPRCRPRWPEA